MKNRYVVLDTSVTSENLGDFIIMDAVNRELSSLVSEMQPITVPTHTNIGARGRKQFKSAEFCVVGGTNILTSNIFKYRQWKFKWTDLFVMDNALLMGVGWWRYQDEPGVFSSMVWRRILSGNYIHSVRDAYTEKKLQGMGIKNVLNTGCATMWRLDDAHCANIPKRKAQDVVFTLTDYRKNIDLDTKLVERLLASYERVYYWPQGIGDRAYLSALPIPHDRIISLAPNLQAFDFLLEDIGQSLDYVGTRLHAGIRALQKNRRSIIIGVDNRAEEKSKSFNLCVVDRKDDDRLGVLIEQPFETCINLPLENIEKFKLQFSRGRKDG